MPASHSERLLVQSFAGCRLITSQANSSFPLAFRVLSPAKRRAMDALYAFMRVTDDLADEARATNAKRANLNRWRVALAAALFPGTAGVPPAPLSPAVTRSGDSGGTTATTGSSGRDARGPRNEYTHSIHPALVDTVVRFGIDPAHLFAVIDGVETDLEPVRFRTFAELYPYCYRVASAVGLACVRVWGFKPGATFADVEPFSEAAGIAFQLTNILRDLGEDLSHGRVYLPEDELIHSPPASWRKPEGAAAFRDMMRFQANRAHNFYRKAEPLDRLLSNEGRAIYRVMSGTYRALLREIEKRNFDVFTERVRVAKWRKAAFLLGAWPVKWGWR